jgi:3-oxoacyl-[acyl-carrier protein] reductase
VAVRSVVVTGGSRGLGLGIVRKLAADGHRSIAIARRMSDELAAEIEQADRECPGRIRFVPFDLSDIAGIPGLVKELRQTAGPIFGLVNNAGIGTTGALAIMHNTEIERLIRLNTLSPIVLTKYLLRYMLADGGGRIVNISSIAGFTGYSGLSVYGATKASLVGFTRALAREVGRRGVTVNAIAPGFVDTEMTQGMDEEERSRIARRSALKRLPDVDDIANAVGYLFGDGAKNITGTVMTIDAGATA